jgi:hypothetical protein
LGAHIILMYRYSQPFTRYLDACLGAGLAPAGPWLPICVTECPLTGSWRDRSGAPCDTEVWTHQIARRRAQDDKGLGPSRAFDQLIPALEGNIGAQLKSRRFICAKPRRTYLSEFSGNCSRSCDEVSVSGSAFVRLEGSMETSEALCVEWLR